jgi:hypothetical protein
MKQVLKQEIKWCRQHRGMSGKGEAFEEGFISGLKQAMFFAFQIEKLEKEDAHWCGVSYNDEGRKTQRAADVCHVCNGRGVIERDGKLQTCVWC